MGREANAGQTKAPARGNRQASVDWHVADAALLLGEEHFLAPVRAKNGRLEAAIIFLVDKSVGRFLAEDTRIFQALLLHRGLRHCVRYVDECLRSYRTEWDEKARAFKKTPDHGWASHGSDAWRYLSLSWRAPMREPEEEKAPIGIPLSDLSFDQFMDIEDSWSMREDRV